MSLISTTQAFDTTQMTRGDFVLVRDINNQPIGTGILVDANYWELKIILYTFNDSSLEGPVDNWRIPLEQVLSGELKVKVIPWSEIESSI